MPAPPFRSSARRSSWDDCPPVACNWVTARSPAATSSSLPSAAGTGSGTSADATERGATDAGSAPEGSSPTLTCSRSADPCSATGRSGAPSPRRSPHWGEASPLHQQLHQPAVLGEETREVHSPAAPAHRIDGDRSGEDVDLQDVAKGEVVGAHQAPVRHPAAIDEDRGARVVAQRHPEEDDEEDGGDEGLRRDPLELHQVDEDEDPEQRSDCHGCGKDGPRPEDFGRWGRAELHGTR